MSYDLTLKLIQIPGFLGSTQVKMTIATRAISIIVFERVYAYSKVDDAFEDMTKVFDQYEIDSEDRLALLKEMLIERARSNGGDDAAEEMRASLEARRDLLDGLEQLGKLLGLHLNSDVPMDDAFVH